MDVTENEGSESIHKNTKSWLTGLASGVALSTALLGLVLAMVSIGLGAGLNYNSEIPLLTAELKEIQMELNESVLNPIDIIGHQISALQTDAATDYGE